MGFNLSKMLFDIFFALRPTCTAPKIIPALAVFSGLFHPMHHRLAAFFANAARGLGELLHFPGKLVIGRSYDGVVLCFSFRNIVKGLFHSAGELIF